MKKFFLLAWAVIAALSFSSCSKDDDGNNDNSEPILSATVHIEQEGTLKNVLQEKKLLDVYSIVSTFNVVSLKITGVLGEDDWEVFSGSIDPLQTLQNLDLSEVTTTSIPKKIFWGTSLHSLILPNKLVTIEEGAFAYSKLTSIKIPASVEFIENDAFKGSSLQSITFEKGSKLKTIGEFALRQTALTSIEIPASVETIGESAIAACSSLSTITFEKGSKLKTIGEYAFFSCTNLKTFDASYCRWLNSIGSGVFFQCNSLQVIKIGTATPPEVFGAFRIDRFPILKVPSESVEAYKNADGWMDFPNISALY